jgi:hypothetical protein
MVLTMGVGIGLTRSAPQPGENKTTQTSQNTTQSQPTMPRFVDAFTPFGHYCTPATGLSSIDNCKFHAQKALFLLSTSIIILNYFKIRTYLDDNPRCSRQHMPLMLFFVDIAGQHVAEKQPV